MNNVHIVGAGPAGWAAACHLARAGWTVDLHSAELHQPYNRVEVSKSLLAGTADIEDHSLGAIPDSVTLHMGDQVRFNGHSLVSQSTNSALTSPVILATGAIPIPLSEFPNAFALRSAHDSTRIREALGDKASRVEIIGAGVLGMEAASSIVDAGHRVRVHDLSLTIVPRMLSPHAGRWLQGVHERRGVEFSLGTSPKITTDSVIITAIGIRPDTSLAEQLGLNIDDGVVIDDLGRTSKAGIYAAGDCSARRMDNGDVRRDEDLASARASGIRSARGVLVDAGQGEELSPAEPSVSRRWSTQAGLRIVASQLSGASADGGSELIVTATDQEYESVSVSNGIVTRAVAISARPKPRGVLSMVGKRWND
ncbi:MULTISPECIES: FAD-dependent oxidoreductase [unclassified Corynebacterium]|uniref:FAD-dependent oxidoreductase n=1 Tax=unclassified Corynebacterium TaxID=2624378 RepID=UPI0030B0268D